MHHEGDWSLEVRRLDDLPPGSGTLYHKRPRRRHEGSYVVSELGKNPSVNPPHLPCLHTSLSNFLLSLFLSLYKLCSMTRLFTTYPSVPSSIDTLKLSTSNFIPSLSILVGHCAFVTVGINSRGLGF